MVDGQKKIALAVSDASMPRKAARSAIVAVPGVARAERRRVMLAVRDPRVLAWLRLTVEHRGLAEIAAEEATHASAIDVMICDAQDVAECLQRVSSSVRRPSIIAIGRRQLLMTPDGVTYVDPQDIGAVADLLS